MIADKFSAMSQLQEQITLNAFAALSRALPTTGVSDQPRTPWGRALVRGARRLGRRVLIHPLGLTAEKFRS